MDDNHEMGKEETILADWGLFKSCLSVRIGKAAGDRRAGLEIEVVVKGLR